MSIARTTLALALSCLFSIAAASAQAPPPLYRPGDAVVTGFSGAAPPVRIAPGQDPRAVTFIDQQGPSLRIVDLQHMRGPAAAQLVAAPKPLTVPAALIGQVFGVALDDAVPPNIYAAATSAYGLPIVAPGPDGALRHVDKGAPQAAFMPGLWGPRGGPGAVWKIDGVTGAVTLFATVTTNGRANSGAALGGIAYDGETRSLFVADRESGLVHRLSPSGAELGVYDHGVTGRGAQGLPEVGWPAPPPLDVTAPSFDSTAPETWHYADPARRVFGLAVHDGRLYYAVAEGLQVWSVGLGPDGAFGTDAVIELAAPPSNGPTEISKIAFDEQNRIYLADRPATTGAFDFEALSVPAIGRVLRYEVHDMVDGRRIWQAGPDDYALGFPADFRNGNGGVAIGYNYERDGEMFLGSCGGFLWSTGEDLREASDPALAARLGRTGPLDVGGLQGNGTWHTRRGGEPPLFSYFIDYDDLFDDPAERGHLGDVAIARLCSAAQRAGLLPPPRLGGLPPGMGMPPPGPPGRPPPPPSRTPPSCQPGEVRRAGTDTCGGCARPSVLVNGVCCSVAQIAATGACSNANCPAGQTPVPPSNFCCNSGQVYSGAGGTQACCAVALVNGQCPTPVVPPITTCGKGYVPLGGSCCLASKVTSTGICCPAGQAPSGPNNSQCQNIVLIPPGGGQCCAAGKIPTPSGQCCAPQNLTSSGVCCTEKVDPANRRECLKLIPLAQCAAGYSQMPDGSCCLNRYVGADGKSCQGERPCGPGEARDAHGNCAPHAAGCAPGEVRAGCPPPAAKCPRGRWRDQDGVCAPLATPDCPRGKVRNARGRCVAARSPPPEDEGPPPPPPPPVFVPPPRRFGPPFIGPPHGPFGPRPGFGRF